MSVWAVMPLRLVAEPKQRLAGLLGIAERRELLRAMATDVLEVLGEAEGVARTVLLADDACARDVADAFGLELVLQDEAAFGEGMRGAAAQAAAYQGERGVATMVLVPADVPLITVAELARLAAGHGDPARPMVSLMPDRHERGTNCMACTPPDAIPFLFGPGSLARHAEAARERDLALRIIRAEGGALDIDTPEDCAELLRRPESAGSRARAALRAAGIDARSLASRAT